MILANGELYLIFIRLIHCFQIEKDDDVDADPLGGDMDPASFGGYAASVYGAVSAEE